MSLAPSLIIPIHTLKSFKSQILPQISQMIFSFSYKKSKNEKSFPTSHRFTNPSGATATSTIVSFTPFSSSMMSVIIKALLISVGFDSEFPLVWYLCILVSHSYACHPSREIRHSSQMAKISSRE